MRSKDTRIYAPNHGLSPSFLPILRPVWNVSPSLYLAIESELAQVNAQLSQLPPASRADCWSLAQAHRGTSPFVYADSYPA